MADSEKKKDNLIPISNKELTTSSPLVGRGLDLARNITEVAKYKAGIIWVDNEEDILRFGERFLRPKGYKVVTFTNSLDAVEELKKNNYDLLLATVVMPVMEGPDLAYVAAELRPKIKTILFFGGITPEEEWEKMNKDSAVVALLSYPLVKDRILATIEKALKINEKG